MRDYHDETLTPTPPCGGTEGVGDTPYPFNDYADVAPRAPRGSAEHVGDSPYPIDSSGDVHPQVDRHDGNMQLHRGQAKPGSFKG